MKAFNFSPIGKISSCYKEKFGIPRQSGLVPAATAELILDNKFGEESLRGLEDFSHIWLSFVFHGTMEQGWKPMVRPPRLGGNTKVGVFASRSTFRPNPMGLSVVELDRIEINPSQIILHLLGCDLLDGTPVLDIKPYLPYADIVANVKGGFAQSKPEILLDISFSDEAKIQCKRASECLGKDIQILIVQTLQLDPRPAYQASASNANKNDRIYAMKLYDYDLKWQYNDNNKIKVIGLENKET